MNVILPAFILPSSYLNRNGIRIAFPEYRLSASD